jgi:hypothetical protein
MQGFALKRGSRALPSKGGQGLCPQKGGQGLCPQGGQGLCPQKGGQGACPLMQHMPDLFENFNFMTANRVQISYDFLNSSVLNSFK